MTLSNRFNKYISYIPARIAHSKYLYIRIVQYYEVAVLKVRLRHLQTEEIHTGNQFMFVIYITVLRNPLLWLYKRTRIKQSY